MPFKGRIDKLEEGRTIRKEYHTEQAFIGFNAENRKDKSKCKMFSSILSLSLSKSQKAKFILSLGDEKRQCKTL